MENIGDRYRVDLMDGDTTVNTFYCDVNDFDVTMVIVGGIVPFIASSGFTDMSVSNETYSYPSDFVSQYIVNNTQLDLDAAYQRFTAWTSLNFLSWLFVLMVTAPASQSIDFRS